MKLTSNEFALKIKDQYPQYKDVDNETLANTVLAKYPKYKDNIYIDPAPGTRAETLIKEEQRAKAGSPLQTQPDMSLKTKQIQQSKTRLESWLEDNVVDPVIASGTSAYRAMKSFTVAVGGGHQDITDDKNYQQTQAILKNISPSHSNANPEYLSEGFFGGRASIGKKVVRMAAGMVPYLAGGVAGKSGEVAAAFGMVNGGGVYEQAKAEGMSENMSKMLAVNGAFFGALLGGSYSKNVAPEALSLANKTWLDIGKSYAKQVGENELIMGGQGVINSMLNEFGVAFSEKTKKHTALQAAGNIVMEGIKSAGQNLPIALALGVPGVARGMKEKMIQDTQDALGDLSRTGYTIDPAQLKSATFTPDQQVFLSKEQKDAGNIIPSLRTPEEHKLVKDGWKRLADLVKQDKETDPVSKKEEEKQIPSEKIDAPISDAINKNVLYDTGKGDVEGILSKDKEGNIIFEPLIQHGGKEQIHEIGTKDDSMMLSDFGVTLKPEKLKPEEVKQKYLDRISEIAKEEKSAAEDKAKALEDQVAVQPGNIELKQELKKTLQQVVKLDDQIQKKNEQPVQQELSVQDEAKMEGKSVKDELRDSLPYKLRKSWNKKGIQIPKENISDYKPILDRHGIKVNQKDGIPLDTAIDEWSKENEGKDKPSMDDFMQRLDSEEKTSLRPKDIHDKAVERVIKNRAMDEANKEQTKKMMDEVLVDEDWGNEIVKALEFDRENPGDNVSDGLSDTIIKRLAEALGVDNTNEEVRNAVKSIYEDAKEYVKEKERTKAPKDKTQQDEALKRAETIEEAKVRTSEEIAKKKQDDAMAKRIAEIDKKNNPEPSGRKDKLFETDKEGETKDLFDINGVETLSFGGSKKKQADDKEIEKLDDLPLAQHAINVASGVKETLDDIQAILAPATMKGATFAKTVYREKLGQKEIAMYKADIAMRKFSKFLNRLTQDQRNSWIDSIETGRRYYDESLNKTINENLELAAKSIREQLDTAFNALNEEGLIKTYIQNYFPRIYKDSKKAEQVFSKRPFWGNKGFLKERTYEYYKDARDAGLELYSSDPIDIVMQRLYDMYTVLAAKKAYNDIHQSGMADVYMPGQAPSSWKQLNIGERYVRKEQMPEYIDAKVYEGLADVLNNIGVRHERVPKGIGGKALGKSWQGGNLIKTKTGTETSVIAHELGHQLDVKYDLWNKLLSRSSGKSYKPGRSELKDIADLTGDRGGNVRSKEEKIAQMVESYVHAPEEMKRVAPRVFEWFDEFIKSHEELSKLSEIEPGIRLMKVQSKEPGELVFLGNYYAPKDVARIINNHLSIGLERKPLYQAIRTASNSLNQLQLGLSGFHALFTSGDAIVSKMAIGYRNLWSGVKSGDIKQIGTGISDVAQATTLIPAIMSNVFRGRQLIKAVENDSYYNAHPELHKYVDALRTANGRIKMDSFYNNKLYKSMMDSFRNGKISGKISGVLKAPFALLEKSAWPIMEWLVPRQKLGVFMDMAKYTYHQSAKEGWSEAKLKDELQKQWDSVDNRMGQMVYDNLFWNKMVKDIGMLSVRSLGWNLGTVREIGGGVKDLKELATHGEITARLSYLIALPITMAWIGAIYGYAHGNKPKELIDYYYPPNEKGERFSIPSYMKDVYPLLSQREDILSMAANKTNPLLSIAINMLENKDYYGNEIRNPDDPWVKQAQQLLGYTATQGLPFTGRNIAKLTGNKPGNPAEAISQMAQAAIEKPEETAEMMMGIMPAPKYITNSKAQNDIAETFQKRMGRPTRAYEGGKAWEAKKDLRERIKKGEDISDAADKYIQDGLLTAENVKSLVKSAGDDPYIKMFKHLPTEDKKRILDKMDNVDEQEKYLEYLTKYTSRSDYKKKHDEYIDLVNREPEMHHVREKRKRPTRRG